MSASAEDLFVIKIISHEILDNGSFKCKFRANISDEQTFKKWLKIFEDDTKTNWIVRDSVGRDKSMFAFSKDYVCHHSSYRKKSKTKSRETWQNKNCPASIKARIKYNTKYIRCRDQYAKEGLLAVISINFQHSHSLKDPESLRYLKRKDETRQKFIEYLNNGMTPTEAKHFHEDRLLADGGDPATLADTSINPSLRWIYYLHDKLRKDETDNVAKLKDENKTSTSRNSKRTSDRQFHKDFTQAKKIKKCLTKNINDNLTDTDSHEIDS